MIIWILFAVVTTATTAALMHPLSSGRLRPLKDGLDAHVYRDQLIELEKELASRQIDVDEYELAKAEAARRLFKAVERPQASGGSRRSHGPIRLAVAVFLPLLSIGLYVSLGSPELQSRPLQARLADPGQDLQILVKKTQDHLVRNPEDGRGWDAIAPVLLKMGRADDAAEAYRSAIRILGPSVTRLDGLSQALMAHSNGIVEEEVRGVLQSLLKLDPANPRARFYIALDLEQEGRTADAVAAFESIAVKSRANAPWLPLVNEHIARNGGTPLTATDKSLANPSKEDVASAENVQADRQQMIRGMVESLDAKLRTDPNNIEGWMRLVRSYAVLNDKDRAAGALKRGLAAFPAGSEQGRQLLALANELGIATEGVTE
ncbi:c-type cytochrome biogenesis protein CcmI [Rhizobium hidalgonense]|uniref:c-type cytochrome biogenesis protein CcmI n=1 Tax=Rhizobium hidalgonense TaxID=1538159 RepID=UPI002870BC29|nr:c-type cytochrome biogenesis protein CcmI [Rhizobium hidalgonense]MDR9808531.1 c-type cytochrome biogenesis protein CcmI [Rhizobium hidalgonense]